MKPFEMFVVSFFVLMLGIVLLSGCALYSKPKPVKEFETQICPVQFPEGECEACLESISHRDVEIAEELYQECKKKRDKCNALFEYARNKHQDCVDVYTEGDDK